MDFGRTRQDAASATTAYIAVELTTEDKPDPIRVLSCLEFGVGYRMRKKRVSDGRVDEEIQ